MDEKKIIDGLTEYFNCHPEGCAWCLNARETAELIMLEYIEREGSDDE